MAMTVVCFCGHTYPYLAGECPQCHCRVAETPAQRDERRRVERLHEMMRDALWIWEGGDAA